MIDNIQSLWSFTELRAGAIFGAAFSCFDHLFGGWDRAIEALALLVVLDIVSGVSVACKKHRLKSAIGTYGMFKKAGIFFCVLIGFLLDEALGVDMFRDVIIAGFALIECISIIENIDKLGYGFIIPAFVRQRVETVAIEKQVIRDKKKEKK